MTRLRRRVVALLYEQGFLPRMRTQEARAGAVAPTSKPGLRTEIAASGASEGVPSQPDEGAGAANPLTDPAADWMDAMAAWSSADIAQHINAETRKDAADA